MEEILSSIKRIIAEEGETPGRHKRPPRAAPATPPVIDDEDDEEEVLELSDPIPSAEPPPRVEPAAPLLATKPERTRAQPQAAPAPVPAPAPPPVAATAPPEPIVSRETAEATRAPLEALTRLMVKPEPGSDGTLESLVREMLRPILREWVDAHLPDMVETMVATEISKIMNQER